MNVLTLPDPRCDSARAHTSPALDPQKPWRHPPWRTLLAVSPQPLGVRSSPSTAETPPGPNANIRHLRSGAAPSIFHQIPRHRNV